MKKTILALGAFAIFLSTCKKPDPQPAPVTPAPAPAAADTTKPVLTLKGNSSDTVALQSTYTDAGATANDNKDGDISPFIVTSGTVNTSAAGNYTITYYAKDAAGNTSSVIRKVHVRNSAWYAGGNYAVACTCTTLNPGVDPPVTGNYSYTATAAVSPTVNGQINVSTMNIGTGTLLNSVNLTISNASMSGYFQQVNAANGNITGTLSPSKTTFSLSTKVNVVNYPNKSYECLNVFKKQ